MNSLEVELSRQHIAVSSVIGDGDKKSLFA
jgi:hypothetical protein